MSKSIDVALVGVNTPAGEMLLQLLAERQFPLNSLYLPADGESAGERMDFADQSLVVQDIAEFDFKQVQLALFVAGDAISEKYIPIAVAAGCVVVDGSSVHRQDEEIPLVVAEVNPQAIGAYAKRGIIACPSPAAVQLLIALKPLRDAVGIQKFTVTALYPVSELGQAGIEELARQTANLLNARPVKAGQFPRQISFNVIPQVGEMGEDGYTLEETGLEHQTRRILADENLMMDIAAVWVPVFYGISMDVQVETRDAVSAEKISGILRKAPGVKLSPKGGVTSYPTAVSDASGNDHVLLGRIHEVGSRSKTIRFWAVADNVRMGVALNCIQIAEILVKEYL